MLQIPTSPVPSISISFAPNELLPLEPKSPFTQHFSEEPDSPRSLHLLPPPLLSPGQTAHAERHGRLSPLSPASLNNGRGLERAKFEAMLKASKERSAMVGAKKAVELRKEIAVKAQKAKQFERRARFLSKLVAPPSPSAADIPVTPPDSPAVFHFTLPSPGLESPLELFENLADHPELYLNKRIEQVDFRLPQQKLAEAMRQRRFVAAASLRTTPLPSLDQISERLSRGPAPITITRSTSPEPSSTASSRLPLFLRSRSASPPSPEPALAVAQSPKDGAAVHPRLALPTLPLRVINKTAGATSRTRTPISTPSNVTFPVFPPSPKSPHPKLQITTTICPPTRSKSSPTEFTEENIARYGMSHSAVPKRTNAPAPTTTSNVPSQRAQVTRVMFNRLSRRTPGLPGAAACGVRAQDDTSPVLSPTSTEDKLKRRTSAPAQLNASRSGVRHPVQDMPGGF